MKKITAIILTLCMLLTLTGVFAAAEEKEQTAIMIQPYFNLGADILGDMTEEEIASYNDMFNAFALYAYANHSEVAASLLNNGESLLKIGLQDSEDSAIAFLDNMAVAFREGDLEIFGSNIIDAFVKLGLIDEVQAEEFKAGFSTGYEIGQEAAEGAEDGDAISALANIADPEAMENLVEVVMSEIFSNINNIEIEAMPLELHEDIAAEMENLASTDDFAIASQLMMEDTDIFFIDEDLTSERYAVTGATVISLDSESIAKIVAAAKEAFPEQVNVEVDPEQIAAVPFEVSVSVNTNAEGETIDFSVVAAATENDAVSGFVFDCGILGEGEHSLYTVALTAIESNEPQTVLAGYIHSDGSEAIADFVCPAGRVIVFSSELEDEEAEYNSGYMIIDFVNAGIPRVVFDVFKESYADEDDYPVSDGFLTVYLNDLSEDILTVFVNKYCEESTVTEFDSLTYPADFTVDEIAEFITMVASLIGE